MDQNLAVNNKVTKEGDLIASVLTGPGEFIVAKTLLQFSRVKGFAALFGPYKPLIDKPSGETVGVVDQSRWSDYAKHDWSLRQLPAISIYESESENKTSDQAWLYGSVGIQVFWPASQRRSDWARVAAAFKGAVENFFSSHFCADMLDELYYIQRDAKVPGLNEYGKELVWTPNTEGIIEDQFVPVTILSIKYRLDLRAWYRALEFDNRTKEDPFERTLTDLKVIGGEYDGVTDNQAQDVEYVLVDETLVNQGP